MGFTIYTVNLYTIEQANCHRSHLRLTEDKAFTYFQLCLQFQRKKKKEKRKEPISDLESSNSGKVIKNSLSLQEKVKIQLWVLDTCFYHELSILILCFVFICFLFENPIWAGPERIVKHIKCYNCLNNMNTVGWVYFAKMMFKDL